MKTFLISGLWWRSAAWATAFAFATCHGVINGVRAEDSNRSTVLYEVTFAGLPSQELDDQVRAASQLLRLIGSPPASVLGLRRRLRVDIQRTNEILKSEGYYGARVIPSLVRSDDPETESEKAQVTLTVLPGARYLFAVPSVQLEPNLETPPGGV